MEEVAAEPVKAEPVAETKPAVEVKMEEATPAPMAAKSSPAKKVEEPKPESPKIKTEDAKPAEGTPKTNEKRGTKRKRGDDEPYVVNEDEPEIPNDFMCFTPSLVGTFGQMGLSSNKMRTRAKENHQNFTLLLEIL